MHLHLLLIYINDDVFIAKRLKWTELIMTKLIIHWQIVITQLKIVGGYLHSEYEVFWWHCQVMYEATHCHWQVTPVVADAAFQFRALYLCLSPPPPMDKTTAISQMTFWMQFHGWEGLYFDWNFSEVRSDDSNSHIWQSLSLRDWRWKTVVTLGWMGTTFSGGGSWTPFQYPIKRLTVRTRKVSKPRDLYLELFDRSEILQAARQQGCRSACRISKRCHNLNFQSRGFETSRDLPIRRIIGY